MDDTKLQKDQQTLNDSAKHLHLCHYPKYLPNQHGNLLQLKV